MFQPLARGLVKKEKSLSKKTLELQTVDTFLRDFLVSEFGRTEMLDNVAVDINTKTQVLTVMVSGRIMANEMILRKDKLLQFLKSKNLKVSELVIRG